MQDLIKCAVLLAAILTALASTPLVIVALFLPPLLAVVAGLCALVLATLAYTAVGVPMLYDIVEPTLPKW